MQPEIWRIEYENTRYLCKATDIALEQRVENLSKNLWSTDIEGKVTKPRNSHNHVEIIKLLFHTKIEQFMRNQEADPEFCERKLRDKSSALYSPPKLKQPFLGSPSCYAKFGEKQYIRDAFKNGILRISPASLYNDSSLNDAQKDDELHHFAVTPNEHLLFRIHGLNSEGKEVELDIEKLELFRGFITHNFLVWCCSLGYDARMFQDFSYDAVLVVRNKEEFRSRLEASVVKQIPQSKMQHRALHYYDPYTIKHHQLKPIFSKNVKYLYQNEYRFAWEMPEDELLKPFLVELGSLQDIAEFYELEN